MKVIWLTCCVIYVIQAKNIYKFNDDPDNALDKNSVYIKDGWKMVDTDVLRKLKKRQADAEGGLTYEFKAIKKTNDQDSDNEKDEKTTTKATKTTISDEKTTTKATQTTITRPATQAPSTGPTTTADPGDVKDHIENSGNAFQYHCVFESSTGEPTFCGLKQSEDDEFNWSIQSGPTPSAPTGPQKAFNGEYYIYIEASDPRLENDTARIELPEVPSDKDYCLTFNYNMFGFHTGCLRVYVKSGDNLKQIWEKIGEQDEEWHDGMVEEFMSKGQKIVFEGVRGKEFSGDIALDNILLKNCK